MTGITDDDLERLSGNRAGQYSIRVNDQWRICFVWRNGDAYDVEVVEYQTRYDLETEKDKLAGRLDEEVKVLTAA